MTDAMLAALAIDHGVTLSSTDTDVERLDGLRHINPLGQQGLFDRGFGQRSRGLRQTFL